MLNYQLGNILNGIALNQFYDGNALMSARELFADNNDYYQCLTRYINGSQNSTDHLTLQAIGNELINKAY